MDPGYDLLRYARMSFQDDEKGGMTRESLAPVLPPSGVEDARSVAFVILGRPKRSAGRAGDPCLDGGDG